MQDIQDADLRQAVALQQVLADLQGTPCGGETAAGESEGAACNRIALSGELLWLAVDRLRGHERHHRRHEGQSRGPSQGSRRRSEPTC